MGGRRVGRRAWAAAAAAVLAFGLVLTGVHLIVRDTVRPEPFGATVSSTPPTGTEARRTTGGASPDGTDAAPQPAGPPAAPRGARPPAPPGSVSFPATDVRADVVPVSTLASGALQLPPDPAAVGWWVAGAAPGAREGTVVLAGHMDGRRQAGAMRALLDAAEGDVVAVTDRLGGDHRYRVTARSSHPRTALDPALFTRAGPHRLVLITCGGRFDHRAGHYEDNIVVVAEPAR